MSNRKCFNCDRPTTNDKRKVQLLDVGKLVKVVKVILCGECVAEMQKEQAN